MPRWALILFFLAAPPGAGAQEVPDSTDWRRYYPLEVGNEWHYRVWWGGEEQPPYGRAVVGDTLIEGRLYFAIRSCYAAGPTWPAACTDDPGSPISNAFVRYGDGDPLLLEWDFGGYARWWNEVPCALDAPFGVPFADPYPCTHPSGTQEYATEGGHGVDYVLASGDTLRSVTHKVFNEAFAPYAVVGVISGVGIVLRYTEQMEFLAYARVGRVEHGTPAFVFPPPVSAEGGVVWTDPTLSVTPNPTSGPARVMLLGARDDRVRVALYDIRGREVVLLHDGPLAAGATSLPLDVPALAPGVYIVHATGGAWGRTTRLIVAR